MVSRPISRQRLGRLPAVEGLTPDDALGKYSLCVASADFRRVSGGVPASFRRVSDGIEAFRADGLFGLLLSRTSLSDFSRSIGNRWPAQFLSFHFANMIRLLLRYIIRELETRSQML